MRLDLMLDIFQTIVMSLGQNVPAFGRKFVQMPENSNSWKTAEPSRNANHRRHLRAPINLPPAG